MKGRKVTPFKAVICFFLICSSSSCSDNHNYPDGGSRYVSFAPDGIPFSVADSIWNVDMRGNHRAVVTVNRGEEKGVVVELPWRRPDLRVDTKKVVVTDESGTEIDDVAVTKLSAEEGEVIFRPTNGEGRYFIYYLPFKWRNGSGDARYGNPWNDYLAPEYNADEAWANEVKAKVSELPRATVDCFESVSKFDFWSPMGLIATEKEMEAIKTAAGKDMIVFPEDRAYPIQLTYLIPAKWNKSPESKFEGMALRNEYYTWQFGIWAANKDAKNVKVEFSDLKSGGSTIPADSITCFNLEGTNWDGSHLVFNVDVPEGRVQALWCGVQIPEGLKPGSYKGTATISADGIDPQVIDLVIKVSSKVLADKGDSEVWRHARLRWLNSTIALDNDPVVPYGEMNVKGNIVEATGRLATVGDNGMLQGISINDKEIFDKPQQLIVSTNGGDVVFAADKVQIQKEAAGLVTWSASSEQEGIKFDLRANMEFDGHMHFDINLSADNDIEVKDVRLVTTYSQYSSEYMMGIGYGGGYRPAVVDWHWDGPYDSYWIGGVSAGLHTEFCGGTYHGPLINDYKPAPTPVWSNKGKGSVKVTGAKGQSATAVASTGSTTITSVPKNYEYNLLITPLKELDTKQHFSTRFYHSEPTDFDKAAEDEANVMNIHHAQNMNPYINYPYIVRDSLIDFINHEHDNGRKVKLYYTIRELTTHCEEVYAFHSLNHEIFLEGVGYGLPWQCEHLIDDYKPAWYTSLTSLKPNDSDAALVVTPNSRYINYFLEGLRWMEENYGLDGIYMDDVSFDRTTVKRIRKILNRYHDGALIDLHSNTWYSVGPANQYTEFFPYVDRLWFGESFRYNEMTPDQWLVTFSGIPFGVGSEMLQDGGNRFLGMVYGTTARHSWTDTEDAKSPVPMWKFWKQFGIEDAKMVGYWDPECAVTTGDPEVKATTYIKGDSILVAVGNFSDKDKSVRLNIDFERLGFNPAGVKITAPAITNFQEEGSIKIGEAIPVKSKEGFMILISQ